MQTVLTVSEVTGVLKRLITTSDELQQMVVRGEVSNFSRPASGHLYFTLKDDKARLRVVMFASKAKYLRFMIQDGMNVVVQGSLDLFERSGDYQLYAESLSPDGLGALFVAFEQLKIRLSQEGLFQVERKRPLPAFPERIALVTSATGAAVRDMIITLRRRYPIGRIFVVPVAVQGQEAPEQIAQAIQLVSDERLADVMIVGRGGGSFEELFAFNTESVARAVAASKIPVISAVGHETDTTIMDFVADVRAATPTAAAEMVSPDVHELKTHIDHLNARLKAAVVSMLDKQQARLRHVTQSPMLQEPERRIARSGEQVDRLERHLRLGLRNRVEQQVRIVSYLEVQLMRRNPAEPLQKIKEKFHGLAFRYERVATRYFADKEVTLKRMIDHLALLSPLEVMRRGYAVAYFADHHSIVSQVNKIQPGDSIHVSLIDGWLDCQVWGVYEEQREDEETGAANT